jgi:hypothetical protein
MDSAETALRTKHRDYVKATSRVPGFEGPRRLVIRCGQPTRAKAASQVPNWMHGRGRRLRLRAANALLLLRGNFCGYSGILQLSLKFLSIGAGKSAIPGAHSQFLLQSFFYFLICRRHRLGKQR